MSHAPTTRRIAREGTRAARALVLVMLLGAAACTDPPAPSDAGADAAGAEDAALDAGTDAGPPVPRWCRPCRLDVQCGGDDQCLYFDDGTSGCGRACATDDDCASLPLAARCETPLEGLPPQCVPAEGSCATIAAGASCESDADCGGTYDRCVAGLAPSGSVCTSACESDADCPFMARRCVAHGGERVCAPDPSSSLDACAAMLEEGTLEACGPGDSCATGSTCRRSGELAVCLRDASGGVCPTGSLEAFGACLPLSPGASPLVPACACLAAPAAPSMLDDALEVAMRDRCDVAFPTGTYRSLYEANPWLADIAQDPFRLSTTDALHADWLAVPRIAQAIADDLDLVGRDPDSVAARLEHVAALGDAPIDPDFFPSRAPGSLGDELEALVTAAGGDPDRGDIDAQIAPIAPGDADHLARVIRGVRLAVEARERAIALYTAGQRRSLFAYGPSAHLGGGTGVAPQPTSAWVQGALRGDVDLQELAQGAWSFVHALESGEPAWLPLTALDVSLTIDTPIGRIAIRGLDPDTYEGDGWAEILFLLDTGGDDVYRAPVGANASIENGVSIAIDLGGFDRYGYDEVPVPDDVGPAGHERLTSDGAGREAPSTGQGPSSLSNAARQGAGRLGIGILWDAGSQRDEYRSLRMSQGYGALGVGVLFDSGGDDLYHAEAGCQGSASFGLGLLVDRGGNDRYVAYNSAQGFAYARAVGVLYDLDGTDEYFTHPTDVLYWNPQDPGGSNTSLAQGAGFGRRADFSDGVFMSGGFGILRDRAGDDRYTTSIFGQATGYWFGTGFLLDGSGDDHYDGQWYVQAGNAHYAIAALIDELGNDDYNALARRMNASVAGGHDFSVAWLIDHAGNDVWRAPNLSLGVGHAGGFGGFVDGAGTDTYECSSQLCFGNASIETPGDPLRSLTGSIGVFLERGGTDSYTRPTVAPVANDASWFQELHTGENEHGGGVDRATGTIGLPGYDL